MGSCRLRILMRAATAIRCDDVDDLDEVEVATVDCYRCDPDNPLAVPRPACPACRGTGRSPVQFVPILREVREARAAKPSSQRDPSRDDDLYLEY
jgi:hypothetical protein